MEYFYIQIFQIVRTKFCCSCLVVVRFLLPVRLISGRGRSRAIGAEEIAGLAASLPSSRNTAAPAISAGDFWRLDEDRAFVHGPA